MVSYTMVDLSLNLISRPLKTKYSLVEKSVSSVKDIRILLSARV